MRWQRRAAVVLTILPCIVLPRSAGASATPQQRALDAALSGTNAVGVVLDGRQGRVIAAVREAEAAQIASAPGSTLKPFFLTAALRQGRVSAQTTVMCHGDLRIAGRNLACTHPREDNVLDSERALAYSCNTWFANLAQRLTPNEAAGVLRAYGFGSRTGLLREEAMGEVRTPRDETEVQLQVLGLRDVAVTPLQLAQAYARLASELDAAPVVRRGLEGSVAYGMAHSAATSGMTIAGKTGTASDPGEAWTHGWFAGIATRRGERVVVVVYVPHGNGADAALLAHRFFVAWGRPA
jgi:cell division protein FtsI/penicillin-binding protein 2